MTDDIVARLRGQRTNGVLCEQAADEIERLRAELYMAKKWSDNYKLAFEKSQRKSLNEEAANDR
jgi:hypothetical protein